MRTGPVTPELLRASVIAVPPLARTEDYSLSIPDNRRIIEHIEKGGIRTLLYGGNANLYHLRPEEYGALLEIIAGAAAEETLVIPSVGPTYGTMMHQASLLAESMFPTAMILPMQGFTTSQGVAEGIRHFVESFGRPVVVYIKNLGYLDPEDVALLTEGGHVSFIKYAIVCADPAEDPYLTRLVEIVDPSIIVSGIGEQPASIRGFLRQCLKPLTQETSHGLAPSESYLNPLKSSAIPSARSVCCTRHCISRELPIPDRTFPSSVG